MSEDCLSLNVFAPIDALDKNGKKYPIIYYIHGSAWDFDSPRSYNPELLIENFVSTGLILVTVQYRLGALGFWTTGNDFGANWAVKGIEPSSPFRLSAKYQISKNFLPLQRKYFKQIEILEPRNFILQRKFHKS